MPYTIWSHGRLVGETDLGFDYDSGNCRAGNFFPTEFGETLMPILAKAGVNMDSARPVITPVHYEYEAALVH